MLITKGIFLHRNLLLTKKNTLNLQIRQLTTIHKGLRNVVACEAFGCLDSFAFLRLMNMIENPIIKKFQPE